MYGETRIPRDMCAGNMIPGETHITVTPVLILAMHMCNFILHMCNLKLYTNMRSNKIHNKPNCIYIQKTNLNSCIQLIFKLNLRIKTRPTIDVLCCPDT